MTLETFNTTHLLTITLIPALIFFSLTLGLKGRSEEIKRRVLLSICCFNAFLYFIYKIAQANESAGDFDIFMNLPLHFCNINLILLPVAIFFKNRTFMAYQFYFGTVLGALALVTIYPGFMYRSLLEFTPFVYFYYHSMLVILPILLVTLKLFTPSFKVVWQPVLMLVGLTGVVHLVNMTFRATSIASEANYFFTYGLRGDFFTELFWSILPYEFFFLLPSLLLFAPFIFFTTLPFHLSSRSQKVHKESKK